MLATLIPALLPVFADLLGRVIPDKAEAARELAKIEASLVEQANQQALAQIDLNKTEAAHGSIFVAGWRPFIGWVCGAGLLWAFIGAPVASWAVTIWAPGMTLPAIQTEGLMALVTALLGLGGMRTFEKMRGLTVNMPQSVPLPPPAPRPSPPGTTADSLMADPRNTRR
jgi:hypothetical protein